MNDWTYHCKTLGLYPTATLEEIKKTYLEQAQFLHPDKHGNSDIAKQKFQQLQESYKYLTDNWKLRAYLVEKPKAPTDQTRPVKPSMTKWIVFSVVCLTILAVAFFNRPEPPKPTITPPPPLSSTEIDAALRTTRLYVSNRSMEDCKLLTKEHGHYQSMMTASDRFPESDCGDVRAFTDQVSIPAIVYVISTDIEACRCQIKKLKNRPSVKGKSSFDNSDL